MKRIILTVLGGLLAAFALACGSTTPNPRLPAPPAATASAAAGCLHGTLPSGACASAVATPGVTVVAPTPTTAPATPAATGAPTIAEGTWTVGEDIPAGTYKVTGAPGNCYWAIYPAGTNQALDKIIDNHLGGGNLRVTLKAGQDFETARCGTWVKQ